MFDLDFSKLAIIGAAALVVIGPEKLPRAARMAGTLFGRAQRYINEVKAEVSREMELDELRNMHRDIREAAGHVERSIAQSVAQTENELHAAWHGDDPPAVAGSADAPVRDDESARKSRDFRKKKLARTSAVPAWYKHRTGARARVISGAARVARHGTGTVRKPTFFD